MSSVTDLQQEMHRQMLLRGNLVAAVLTIIATGLVQCWLVPDAMIATLSFGMAAGLLLLSAAGRRKATPITSGGSLAILGLGLTAMYLRGVTHDPGLDQALNCAVLLPILAYACLVGAGLRWLAVVTSGTLVLILLAYLVNGQQHGKGLTVLFYSVFYTLAAAAVAVLFSLAHRRVLAFAESETARARLAEARLRAMIDAIPNPIYAKDRDLRYVDANAALCQVVDRKRSEIIGRTVHEVVDPVSAAILHHKDLELLEQGGTQVYEGTFTYPDGSEHPLIFHKALVHDAEGRPDGVVGIFIDLSERHQMQARLLQAEKLEALGRLAGGVAHDMNNQLTGVLGYAEMLAARLPDGPDREDARSIVAAATRAANLPRQLLAFARKGKYLAVPVPMHPLVDEIATMLSRSIGPGIIIDLRMRAAAHTVMGDPGQLQSMLLNLALNARDAMPEGGRLILRSETVALPDPAAGQAAAGLPAGRYLRLEVVDSGHGMDEAVQRRLFEPFFTTKGTGTGLGLASVYGAVRNHHGGIAIRSAPGQGSTFTILLPLAPEPADAAGPAAPTAFRRQRLLVIDDEDIVRMVLVAMLGQLGHEPVPCRDGQEALDLLAAGEQVDGAVLDLLMPGMSGHETFHRLHALRPGLAVVIASGHHDDQEAQRLLDAGARAFVCKPVPISRLAELFGRRPTS